MTPNLFRIIITFATVLIATYSTRANDTADIYVYKGAGCTGKAKINTFEQLIGRRVDGVVDFAANKDWNDVIESTGWIAGCWRGTGYKLSLSIPMLPLDKSTSMSAGVNGEYNPQFQLIGNKLVSAGFGNASIRIGWEFNGNWYRWGSKVSSSDYKTYFRQIVSAMRSVPNQSFKFIWNPAIGQSLDLSSYYPGDDVVDIIGLDFYNQSWRPVDIDFDTRWKYFENQPFGLNWFAEFSGDHQKALALPEWGTGTRPDGHGFGDDNQFIKHTANWIQTHNVVFQGYWDYSAPDFNAILSTGTQPNAAAEFKKAFH